MSSEKYQYGSLISTIKKSFSAHLEESFSDMIAKADEAIFEIAKTANSGEDRNRYFNLLRDSRALNETISNDFIDSITSNLRPFSETAAEKKKNNEGELSLVDQSEMEDIVLIKSMSDSVAGLFSEPLSHLEARLEHLALQTPHIFYKKALHPANIFQAFDDALGNNFDFINKKTLFKFFNDYVALKLRIIYDEINNMLIAADILPQIKLHLNKSTTASAPGRAAPSNAGQSNSEIGTNEPQNSGHAINQGGYAMTASPGHGNQSLASHGSTPGSQSAPDQSGGGFESSNAANKNTVSSGYQHITAGLPASQIGEVVGQFIGGAPLMPADSTTKPSELVEGSRFFPASTNQYYGHQEILNALSNVQHNPLFSNTEYAKYDGEAIKQAVLSEIARTSGGVVTKSINRIAEKTIDFIELIFDAIIEDENISDTIRALLLRLQIPVIKASMIDQEFFIYDDHPARVLLDKIALVGIGVADRHDEIYGHLDKIVTTLVNEFELQADIFQVALDALNTFIEAREAAALKKEEEEQQRVLREHARSTVLKSLRFATKGRVLPETIHSLVLKRWPTMMYNHYLKYGKENDTWVNIVDVLRSIIVSVQPLKNSHDLQQLVSSQDYLIKSIRGHLQTTNQPEEYIAQVIKDLTDIHQSLIEQADFEEEAEVATGIIEAIIVADAEKTTAIGETSAEPDEPAKLQLPSRLIPGMWFQVYNGEDRAQRRCKLSVVILEDQKLIFVNYQGEVILEKNLGAFLAEIAEGKSKVIMGHSVFDHALSSVVQGLQLPH